MTSGDWLPAQAPFDLVRRGYAPEQVTAHLEQLEYDLRITSANRDATNQRLNELGSQLAAAQAEADTLRAQLDRNALEPVSMANLSDRMQRMIRLAEEEAAEIRARSAAEADRLRAQLEAALSDAVTTRASFDTEREHARSQLAEQVNVLIAEATSEALTTTTQAHQEATRLVAEAGAEVEQLTTEAAAENARLDADATSLRSQVEEDFHISITARRQQAHQEILNGQQVAAESSQHLIQVATAESELLTEQATTYSSALVNRAAAESHQRVTDADNAVDILQVLRGQLLDQLQSLASHLDHIRNLAGEAPGLISPSDSEQDRPVAAEFPANPFDRPTVVDLPHPVLETADSSS